MKIKVELKYDEMKKNVDAIVNFGE